jgi:hypothetical protein
MKAATHQHGNGFDGPGSTTLPTGYHQYTTAAAKIQKVIMMPLEASSLAGITEIAKQSFDAKAKGVE